jgi:hypothetical protein
MDAGRTRTEKGELVDQLQNNPRLDIAASAVPALGDCCSAG